MKLKGRGMEKTKEVEERNARRRTLDYQKLVAVRSLSLSLCACMVIQWWLITSGVTTVSPLLLPSSFFFFFSLYVCVIDFVSRFRYCCCCYFCCCGCYDWLAVIIHIRGCYAKERLVLSLRLSSKVGHTWYGWLLYMLLRHNIPFVIGVVLVFWCVGNDSSLLVFSCLLVCLSIFKLHNTKRERSATTDVCLCVSTMTAVMMFVYW